MVFPGHEWTRVAPRQRHTVQPPVGASLFPQSCARVPLRSILRSRYRAPFRVNMSHQHGHDTTVTHPSPRTPLTPAPGDTQPSPPTPLTPAPEDATDNTVTPPPPPWPPPTRSSPAGALPAAAGTTPPRRALPTTHTATCTSPTGALLRPRRRLAGVRPFTTTHVNSDELPAARAHDARCVRNSHTRSHSHDSHRHRHRHHCRRRRSRDSRGHSRSRHSHRPKAFTCPDAPWSRPATRRSSNRHRDRGEVKTMNDHAAEAELADAEDEQHHC